VYWLAEICVRRPVFALMIVMAFVVAGAASFPQLGVDRFPNMDLPSVYVRTIYPGAASQEVESEVSQVIEDAVATVAGIDELRSISSDGTSFVMVTFNLNRNLDAAAQDVRDAVGSVLNRLPPGLDPPVVQKQDTDSSPIITLAVSGPRTSTELYLLADRFVKNVIESAPGVGQVTIAGAADRAVQVNIDARRLAAQHLSILQVRDALAWQNAEVPGGRMDEGRRERSLRTLGRVEHARDFPDLVVATIGGTPVRLSELGAVRDATKEVRTLARLDGEPAVVLQVQRQSGENTVKVIEGIKQRLPRCRALLPADVQVTVIQDQSRYILAALHEIEGHLIAGSILACITVLLFMKSWRSTLIAGVAIPASIVATFACMKAFNFTLNNVTMLALVLMVGVVIDDAIVVLENVFHCIEEKGMDPFEASIAGTREIGPAVLSTTLSLVIVFLPVSFLSSVTGRMLFEFGITATVAIMVSMLISFTLTPMMCSKLLKGGVAGQSGPASRRGFYHWLEVGYLWCLKYSLRHRWLVLVLSLAVVAANVPLYQLVKQDYIPTNVDESEFEVRMAAVEGANLQSMNEVITRAEREVRDVQGVELVLATVGSRGISGVNRGELYVRLQDIKTRAFSLARLWRGLLKGDPGEAFRGNFSQRDKMTEIRRRLNQLADVTVSVRNLTSLRQGAPVDIDFSITGPDIQTLVDFSDKLKEKAKDIPRHRGRGHDPQARQAGAAGEHRPAAGRSARNRGPRDCRNAAGGCWRRRPRVAVSRCDRRRRLRRRAAAGRHRSQRRGVDFAALRADGEGSGFEVQGSEAAGLNSEPRTLNPGLTRIDNVVDFSFATAPARIDRLDRQRMVALRANLGPGYALSDRVAALNDAAKEVGIPPGFETRVLGRGREMERTLADFVWTFALSFVFMYIVIAAQYEHLVHPFTILLSLPLAVPFGLVSLYWGGETLNLYSALGILVLFGVVKKASILQVDHTNVLRAKGLSRFDAIMQANRDRLRPILMTTIAFVAGLLPLLIGTGPGAEERRSIAVLAVGGQTLSLLLTLLAVPVIYSYFDDVGALAHWLVRRLEARPAAVTPPVLVAPAHPRQADAADAVGRT
jgi:HAE1 family hydrophobic/amphiphilic exporter-1